MKTTKASRSRQSARILAGSIAALLATQSAHAVSYDWDGSDTITSGAQGGSGVWNTSNLNWWNGSADIAWPNLVADDAVFGGTDGTVSVSGSVNLNDLTFNSNYTLVSGTLNFGNPIVAAGSVWNVASTKTATIASNLSLGVSGNFATGFTKTGAGEMVISGIARIGDTATFGANVSPYNYVTGSGQMTVSGILTSYQTSTQTSGFVIGRDAANVASANNTVTVTGQLLSNRVTIGELAGSNNNRIEYLGDGFGAGGGGGGGAFGGMTGDLSGNNVSTVVGGAGTNNVMYVGAGAFINSSRGNGTNVFRIGNAVGGNNNGVVHDGRGANHVSTSPITVGFAGSNNYFRFENGAFGDIQKVDVGSDGTATTGTNNFVLATGLGTELSSELGGNNGRFSVGLGAGASMNNMTYEAGAVGINNSSRNTFNTTIGAAIGANDNYIRITGAGTTFRNINTVNVGIGQAASTGNHLDVYAGANFRSTAISVNHATSAFNLGNGSGISTAQIDALAGVSISLAVAGAQLNINSGRLIAGSDGSLVSGATGLITLNGNAFIDTAQLASTITAPITGAGGFIKEGTGLLTVSGGSNHSGGTTVNHGTLAITTASAISGGALTLGGGTLSVGVAETTTGTTLNSGGSSVTGAGTVALGGIVRNAGATVDVTGAGIATTTTTNDASGILGAYATVGGAAYAAETAGAIGAYAGTGTATFNVASAGTNYDVTLAGGDALTGVAAMNTGRRLAGAGNTLDLAANTLTLRGLMNAGADTLTIVDSVTGGSIGHATELIVSGAQGVSISAVVSGGMLTKTGAGNLTLSGANTYTGTTTVNAGTVTLGASDVLSAGSLVINRGVLDMGGNNDTIGALLVRDGGSITSSGGVLTTGGVVLDNKSVNGPAVPISITAVLAGTGGLQKIGVGTATLSGANTYAGATTITEGTLAFSGNGTLGTGVAASAVVMGNGFGASLDVSAVTAGNFDVGSLSGGGGSVSGLSAGSVVLGTKNLFVGYDNTSTTFNGVISGAGGLRKVGTGILTLTGRSTYDGTNEIQAGTIKLGDEGSSFGGTGSQYRGPLGGGAATGGVSNAGLIRVFPGATLDMNGMSYDQTVLLRLAGTGDATNSYVGALANSGARAVNYRGAVTLDADTTIDGGTGAIVLGNFGYAASLNGDFSLTLQGAATGSGIRLAIPSTAITVGSGKQLIKTGTGDWTLHTPATGSNAYTGDTLIQQGTLKVNTNAFSSSSVFVLSDATTKGTLQYIGTNFTRSLAPINLVTSTVGAEIDTTTYNQTLTIAAPIAGFNTDLTIGGAGNTTTADSGASDGIDLGAGILSKEGTGILTFDANTTQTYSELRAKDGTTNVNTALGSGSMVVAVTDTAGGAATKLRFGTVSQTLASLSIGAGATVVFTSGTASGAFGGDGGDGKAPSFGGAIVPEPGTVGLLLAGSIGLLIRRRRT